MNVRFRPLRGQSVIAPLADIRLLLPQTSADAHLRGISRKLHAQTDCTGEVAMFADRLIAGDAIRPIKSAIESGDRVLDVDGFLVASNRFVAALDLVVEHRANDS